MKNEKANSGGKEVYPSFNATLIPKIFVHFRWDDWVAEKLNGAFENVIKLEEKNSSLNTPKVGTLNVLFLAEILKGCTQE